MAVLETIRVKFGIGASIIIALGLLLFIVDPSDIDKFFTPKDEVGKIAGKTISYSDFKDESDRLVRLQEMLSGASLNAQQQAQVRDMAWQNDILRYLFVPNAEKAGLNIGKAEYTYLLTDQNGASPVVSQNPVFYNENGVFDPQRVLNLSEMSVDDPQAGLIWDNIYTQVSDLQYMSKYNALFTGSSVVTPLSMRNLIKDNNNVSDVDFIMVPYGYSVDSTIVVSDSEISAFFNNHKKFFSQAESRDIEYVVFDVIPSLTDLESTKEDVAQLRDKFAADDNAKTFLTRNASERQFDGRWYKVGELRSVNKDVEDFAWKNSAGATSDVIASGSKFFVTKVVDVKQIPDSVYVRHILLTDSNVAKADSILNVLSAGKASFSALAEKFSADDRLADGGELGNIGWLTQNYMYPGFESTVFTAAKGKPYLIKASYGTHIVEVVRTTKAYEKRQIAIYERTAVPSSETFNSFYSQANEFAVAAHAGLADYRKAVEAQGVYSHPFPKLSEGADKLGSISNANAVTRWAFDQKKPGNVSDIITIDNKYFVIATVTGVHKEGTAKLDEVAETIRQRLYYEKLGQKKTQEIADQIAGLTTLEEIAEKLNVSVSSRSGINFSAANNSMDNIFLGAVAVAEEGKVSAPIAGVIGTYIFKVTSRDTGAFFTEDDARSTHAQYVNASTQGILPIMMEAAGVKDHRARYF